MRESKVPSFSGLEISCAKTLFRPSEIKTNATIKIDAPIALILVFIVFCLKLPMKPLKLAIE